MASVAPTVSGVTNSQLTMLLALASEHTAVRPTPHLHTDTVSITIPPALEPKTGMLSNIKVVIFVTEHLRCTLTYLDLLADLQQRVVSQWRPNLAAVLSQVQSEHNNTHDSERELIAKLLETLFGRMCPLMAQQSSLRIELGKEKTELEKKLSSHNKWMGRWNTIYMIAFFAVQAGSVALAAAAAPTSAMTTATVVSAAMKAAEPLFDALWDDRKAALEGEKDVIKAMDRDVSKQLRELNTVKVHVKKLITKVGSLIERRGNPGSFNRKMKKECALAIEKVDNGIKALGEMLDGIQGDMKKATADFVSMIANEA